MPKGSPDETKLKTGGEEPGALGGLSHFPAASDGPQFQHEVPRARAPRPPARRGGPGGLILAAILLMAAAGAVWYFFFR